jgi:toxin YoeB
MRIILFSSIAMKQLDEWKMYNPNVAIKIVKLITEISETPFTGSGKPEALKYNLKGKWSRRITQEHRLVYEVTETTIKIISCKFHYS